MSILILAVVLVLSITACGSGGNNENSGQQPNNTQKENKQPENKQEENNQAENTGGSEEPVEITFLSLITPNLNEDFWNETIGRFEERNPGIKVNRIQAPSLEGLNDNYAKTLLASGDFPDVLSNISYQDFVKADALLEIPIDDDIKKINDYESLLMDDKLYTLQGYLQPHTLMYYNKKMFAEAGIDELPKSWDEFEAVAGKLKDTGFTPILAAGDWVTTLTFTILTSPEIFGNNPVWYADRNAGKVSYQDDNWMELANRFHGLFEKGYFNKGALSIGYTEVEQEFLKGNAAMYPMGSWFSAAEASAEKDFEVGVFAPPTLDGSGPNIAGTRGTSFAVSKTTDHPEAAVEFAKFLILDPETHKNFSKGDGMFSGLVDPINYEFSPLQQEIFDIIQNAGNMTGHEAHRAGDFPVNGIANQYTRVGQALLLENADVEKEMASLDEYWDSNK